MSNSWDDLPPDLDDDESEEIATEVRPKPPLTIVRGTGETRPDIKLTPNIHETTDRMVDVLRKDASLYVRSGELVHVVRAEDERVGKATVIPGTPIVRSAPLSYLRDRVSLMGRCIVEVRGKKGATYKHVPPPRDNVQAVRERGHWPAFRPLSGILETPALKPNGKILQTPGYDAETGYLYEPNATYAEIAEKPTHADAQAALKALQEPFLDFPYAHESHLSAVLAAILTLLARPAIVGSVPLFFFDASAPRSGKGLQVDVVSIIATGRAASRTTYPTEDEELEKIVSSYAMAGTPLVNFDNVSRPFGGDALDKVITAVEKVDLRILGRTGIQRVDWRSVIFASGNNVTFRGDMAPRVLAPRLESKAQNPETRTDIRHANLRQYARDRRMSLVGSGLTVLRGYVAAGCPDMGTAKWGGFESWSRLIPHALVWAGAPDPMQARRGLGEDTDPDRLFGKAVIAAWPALCAGAPTGITGKKALDTLYPGGFEPSPNAPPDGFDELREAIAAATGTKAGCSPSVRALGDRLRRIRARVFPGGRIEGEITMGGVMRWRVEPV